ncbi:MAG: hypothetical protein H8D23_13585 [Candidatus Brocadiales bacterium]|nr:hypothetical protein [Candidatus Brocadiales bacterium]
MRHSKILKAAVIFSIGLLPVTSAVGFGFGDMMKQMQDATKNVGGGNQGGNPFGGMMPSMGQQKPSNQASSSNTGNRWIEESCRGIFGSTYEKVDLGKSPEEIVSQYFITPPDLEQRLYEGINTYHTGSFNQLTRKLIDDLEQNKAKRIAEAFKGNPSIEMLAQVIRQSETADSYEEMGDFGGGTPSVRTEMKTVLALIMLQYPDLLKEKQEPVAILKKTRMKYSKLSSVMLARFHLYGDYQDENIDAFSNYIANGSGIKNADSTIVWAMENVPNWKNKKQYEGLMKQSQEMQKSLNRQKQKASGSTINARALKLMQKGLEIDALTADAFGAGDEIAKIRATGTLMEKEASGEDNLIEIKASQNADSAKIIQQHLAAKKSLSGSSKQKFEEANAMRVKNHAELVALQGAVAVKFFTEGLGEALNSGPYINQYFRDSCQTTMMSTQFAENVGVVTPVQPAEDLADEL